MKTLNHNLLRGNSPPKININSITIKTKIMKHLFYIFTLLVISINSSSQLTKGHWLVGGTGKIFSYKNNFTSPTYNSDANYTEIDLSPNIGYFITDKIAFGIRPSFNSFKGEVTTAGGGSTNVQRYWLGPFGRFYFLNEESPTNILLDASYQFGFYNFTGQKGKLRNVNISAGPVVYFNSTVGIEFLLGYRYELEDIDQIRKDIKKGFQFSIGLQVHLTK